MPYYINDECINCGACPDVCPVNAIESQRPPIAEPYLSIIQALLAIVAAVEDLAFTGEKIEIPALGMTLAKLGKTLAITRE